MSGSLLLRRRGPPLTTPVPGARGALPAVKFVVMSDRLPWFGVGEQPPGGLRRCPKGRNRSRVWSRPVSHAAPMTRPEESSTVSTPGPGSVLAPKSGVNRISSLASVQVKSCLGCSVGAVPAIPPAAPDQSWFPVEAVHLARRAVRRGRGYGVRDGRDVRSLARPWRKYEARTSVHGLAHEVAVDHRDACEVPRRAVVLADHEVSAVHGSQRVCPV